MTDPTARRRTAETALAAASRRLTAAVMANVVTLTLEYFPEANKLLVFGLFGESGFTVRAQRVIDAGDNILAGYDVTGQSSSEEWDDFTDEVDPLLDELGEQNEDDWTGRNEIALHSAPPAPTTPLSDENVIRLDEALTLLTQVESEVGAAAERSGLSALLDHLHNVIVSLEPDGDRYSELTSPLHQ